MTRADTTTDLVFIGSGAFGLPTLASLAGQHRLGAIVTQPDRPAGRGKRQTPTPVSAWAAEHLPGCPLIKAGSVNDAETRDRIRACTAETWIVIAFGQKLGRELLEDRFAVNLHASLLPRWRGAAPIHHAILAGDAHTGNSVITLAERMDAGRVLAQSDRLIEPTQTTGELHDLLAADGPALVSEVLDARRTGVLDGWEQDPDLVTLAPKLAREDARVDFRKPADECRRRINGLSPWPGVSAECAGARLKLVAADSEQWSGPVAEPGTLVDRDRGLVACGQGVVRLVRVQPSGKRPMEWAEFARGHRVNESEAITPV